MLRKIMDSPDQPDEVKAFVLGIMAVGCFALFTLLTGGPVWNSLQSQAWDAHDCRTLETAVRSGRHRNRISYSLFVRYQYEVNGKAYNSTREDFAFGTQSGRREEVEAIAAALAPGSAVQCWVNPLSPSESVLSRDLPRATLFGLIPLGIGLVALMGFLFLVRRILFGDDD